MAQNQTEVVLITGASGGIGKAVAEKFAQNGYRVALHYHNGKERAEALQRELEAQGCTVMAVQADLRESSQAEAMIKQIEQQWGSVDVLVNNAGVMYCQGIAETSERMLKLIMMVHMNTPLLLCRKYVNGMKERGCGYILNISSLAAWMSWPGIGMYGNTKRFD